MVMRVALSLVSLALTVTACGADSRPLTGPGLPTQSPSTSAAPEPTVAPGVAGSWPDLTPPTAGSCVSEYPKDLRENVNAFDATVTAVSVGDFDDNAGMRPATVDLAVHEVFAGPERRNVQMRTWDGFLPRPKPESIVGLRVLASAGDTLDLKACGFTRPYSTADAQQWRTVFG